MWLWSDLPADEQPEPGVPQQPMRIKSKHFPLAARWHRYQAPFFSAEDRAMKSEGWHLSVRPGGSGSDTVAYKDVRMDSVREERRSSVYNIPVPLWARVSRGSTCSTITHQQHRMQMLLKAAVSWRRAKRQEAFQREGFWQPWPTRTSRADLRSHKYLDTRASPFEQIAEQQEMRMWMCVVRHGAPPLHSCLFLLVSIQFFHGAHPHLWMLYMMSADWIHSHRMRPCCARCGAGNAKSPRWPQPSFKPLLPGSKAEMARSIRIPFRGMEGFKVSANTHAPSGIRCSTRAPLQTMGSFLISCVTFIVLEWEE